ncbi:MAG: apolipoprotein N-acyltransferase [Rhizobiales bacterium]|nr:apolipoprotein N-acyltransferase [Hyphomicrobiales bacterium]
MSDTGATRTFLDRAIASIIVLWGWRRLAVSCLAGAATALSLAPYNFLPVLFITIPVLIWLLDGAAVHRPIKRTVLAASLRTAFAIGWSFGFGYFLAGLYWIGFALLVDAEQYAWAMPLALIALPAGLALFIAIAAALAQLLWIPGYCRIAILAAAWTTTEWLRSFILTGFPWNLIGQAFTGSAELMQPAAFVGDLGLSLVVMLIAGAPATLADPGRRGGVLGRASPTLAALIALAAIWIGGSQRIAAVDPGLVPGVSVRIVQPNVDQASKWEPGNRSKTVALYLEMSDSATSPQSMGIDHVTHLIWPETSLPLLLANEPQVMAQIAALLPAQSHLIAGALRAEPPSGGPEAHFFNSVLVIDGEGRLTSSYDKRRLVPFGEFLPFQEQLEALGLRQLTGVVGGFTAGAGSGEPLRAGAVPRFASLICYEIIFSTNLFDAGPRPGWMVNVTNDAWYRDTSGPWQHLAQAQLRAVEQGLPVVRAANTGVSAIIDAYGRIEQLLGYGRRGVIDSRLPAPLEPTFFSRFTRLPVAILLALIFLVALAMKWRQQHRM